MGEAITPGIHAAAPKAKGQIQHLFNQQGDVDEELISLGLFKTIGPERYNRDAELPAPGLGESLAVTKVAGWNLQSLQPYLA